jgi:hypothetical protein
MVWMKSEVGPHEPLSARQGVTLFLTLLAAFEALLYAETRISGARTFRECFRDNRDVLDAARGRALRDRFLSVLAAVVAQPEIKEAR